MSLATRCAACGTVFRVVSDQLKVSEGWVRCGHCGEVFNAEECLLGPLPDEDDSALVADGSLATEATAETPLTAERDAGIKEWAADATAPGSAPPTRAPAGNTAATTSLDSFALPDPRLVDPEPFYFDTDALAASFKASALVDSDFSFEPGGERDPEAVQPGFLRRAERAERWRRPAIRGVLGLACAALATLLVAQLAYLKRDELAAHWPATRPVFLAACGALGCKLSSPLQIEDIALDNSQLSATSRPHVLRLDVSLHNQARNAVLMPAMELSFMADTGDILVRRVVQPAQFARGAEALEAEGHSTSTVWVDVGDLPVAGYTVAVFYP